MTQQLKEYRVTRPELYGPKTLGHKDPSARQGYYVDASSPEEARQLFWKRLLKENPSRGYEMLDVSLWYDPVTGECRSHKLL